MKAIDGRRWWGSCLWLWVWCLPADCLAAEQPDVYVRDFYDAPYMVTQPAEWGDGWQKRTLLFVRGSAFPQPPAPGARGTSDWHNRSGRRGELTAPLRDGTSL